MFKKLLNKCLGVFGLEATPKPKLTEEEYVRKMFATIISDAPLFLVNDGVGMRVNAVTFPKQRAQDEDTPVYHIRVDSDEAFLVHTDASSSGDDGSSFN